MLGDLDYSTDDDDARPVRIQIAELILHPQYTNRQTKFNDIGLIRLETEVIFNEYIRPACLPESNFIGFRVTAAGWGQRENSTRVSHLRKTELTLVTHQVCNADFQKLLRTFKNLEETDNRTIVVNDIHICAGGNFRREDTCAVNLIK